MIVKFFGGIDLIAGLLLIFWGSNNKLDIGIIIFLAIVLFLKSLIGFLENFGSWIDFLLSIFIFLSFILSLPEIIFILLGLLISQKGIFSFM